MKNIRTLALGLGLALFATIATAQAPAPPQVQSIGPNDLFQDVVNGQAQAGNFYANGALLGNFSATQPGGNADNFIIGGDAQNLFQRGTTGSSVTTTVTYGGPDRWAYWSGTSTAMTVSQDSTAADLPTNSKFGFKMARTSGQTGVVQMCMAQEIETLDSYGFRGTTVEVDLYLAAGANFSAASNNVTVYLITGTGSDEGMQKEAWGLNAGGGGSTAWAGQVNTGVTFPVSTAPTRYSIAYPTPTTTTEAGIAICYTPVGTAGTNDYLASSTIQLGRNSALAAFAGSTGAVLPVGDTRARSIVRRPVQVETALQQRYFVRLTETAAITPVATCSAIDTTHTNCLVPFPVTMRIAPAMAYANGFATPTSTTQATLGACTTLGSAATVASTVANPGAVLVNCTATTVPAAGVASFLYSNGGTGTISANAEL